MIFGILCPGSFNMTDCLLSSSDFTTIKTHQKRRCKFLWEDVLTMRIRKISEQFI